MLRSGVVSLPTKSSCSRCASAAFMSAAGGNSRASRSAILLACWAGVVGAGRDEKGSGEDGDSVAVEVARAVAASSSASCLSFVDAALTAQPM